jgi:CopG antitoxin of type II toxin-antitoxin system
MAKKKRTDPIPDEFASYEEAGEFWDSHDTTDYPNAFRTVKVVSRFRNRHYEFPLAPDVLKALQVQAREKHMTLGHVANDLLRRRLRPAG